MFENAAHRLQMLTGKDVEDTAIIQQFLVEFAEHILWYTTPVTGSPIKRLHGLLITEMVPLVPDMPKEEPETKVQTI